MRWVRAGVVAAILFAAPAYAQNPTPDKPKTTQEIQAERDADKAYQKSLGNIPDKTVPSDPWGTMRSGDAPKQAEKPVPSKRMKTGNLAKPGTPAK